jgi:hypothetical protein
MTPKTFGFGQISASGKYRWQLSKLANRTMMRLKFDRQRSLRRRGEDGQSLAGTGALVFEGELLELPRRP